jgi:hypothetical protein
MSNFSLKDYLHLLILVMLDHNGDCYVVGGMFLLEAR